MTSYASEMPGSPGCIDQYDLYKRPQSNPYEEQRQQLSAVQEENLRLKANLTRVQNEYEELRDESNYQRVKVSELTEQVASSGSLSTSFRQSHHTPTASNEYGESAIHNSLIEKSLQNAQLTLAFDQLKNELHKAKARLANLELQKRANSKLLLEMGDVIRTLNSVDIDYVPLSPKGEKLTAQQLSIKNIKLKVEAMLKDRNLLIQDCRKLSLLTRAQEQKLRALESQFHVVNTVNISEGVSLGDIEINKNLQPTLSLSASTLSDDMMSQQSSIVSKESSRKVTDAAASEIVRQSQELAKYKKQEEKHAREIDDLQFSQKTHKETISRLESENERLSTQLNRLKESLGSTKILLKDAVIKRDEFKGNLVDIIAHYKELQVDHEASNGKITELESMVVKMQSVVRKTRENQAKQESKEIIENTMDHDCNKEDLLVAYGKAQQQIEELQESLMEQELEVGQHTDTITRFKKMESERNDFQQKLDQALEETRLAKEQVQKEKDESKQIRRQLKTLMQHRDDETASIESGNNSRRSASSTRSHSTGSQATKSKSCRSLALKKALVKKASFKPLTVEELMKKDFA